MSLSFFASSRGKIIKLLRQGPQSVNQLAAALKLTDNAVRAQLAHLEQQGLVTEAGTRPSFRKPESVYDITPAAQQLFEKAYAPILSTLLGALESRLDEKELDEHLHEVARRLAAPHLPSMAGLTLKQRAKKTLKILEALGGLAAVEERDGQIYVQGFGCPFSQVVAAHPKLCQMAEMLVGELLGTEVQEVCQRGDRPKCCFVIKVGTN
jgi:predicted ArsR family transcriptional regulator